MTDAQEAGKMASEPNVSGECDLCALSPCISDAENGWHISKVTGSRFRCTAAPTAAAGSAPPDLNDAIAAIEEIVGSEELEEWGLEKANGKLSERELAMYERLSKAYQISHAFNPKHSCYKVHEDWRRLARAAFQGEPGGEK